MYIHGLLQQQNEVMQSLKFRVCFLVSNDQLLTL